MNTSDGYTVYGQNGTEMLNEDNEYESVAGQLVNRVLSFWYWF